jgi:NAD(P)H dehydrogenase (quinone)
MKKILVTGATGSLGMGVITTLLSKTNAKNVYALARSEEKAASLKELGVNVRIGDYDYYDSLLNAFKGIDTLYMVSNTDVSRRITQQDNVVEAALEAGITHIVYTSYLRKTESVDSPIRAVAAGHLNTEAKLKESGTTYTILKHGTYTEMIPVFAGHDLLTKHLVYVPAGDGKTSFVRRNDLSEAGATILLDETGKYDNQSLELTGPKALSWGDIADIIGSITNLPIKYVSPSEDEYKKVATEAGVPAGYVNLFANFSKVIKAHECDKTTSTLEEVLGHRATAVETFLKEVYDNN